MSHVSQDLRVIGLCLLRLFSGQVKSSVFNLRMGVEVGD